MNIDTTSDEKFNKEVWDVLEEIKLSILRAKNSTLLIKFKNNPLELTGDLVLHSEAILEKLVNKGAINIIKDPIKYAGMYTFGNPTTTLRAEEIDLPYYKESVGTSFLEILHPKFEEVYDIYKSKNSKKEERIESPVSLWISKKDNNYYFDGNRIYIKSEDAGYAIIFDVAYSLKPQGGKIEYKKIIEQCKKRKIKITQKSILRALTGKDANLFKYVKEIRQEPKYGISLFVAMQDGKEIEFNNKK
ncbi:hypothetical protein A3F29_03890 [Candidatus Roizmanbacteria bacterium RIFCSPHIGHO2_12_FULL_33_9]|uniref:Uncharacterized protein n=1 Tax=Candidatus Roizmanbacteria bacterium RIFCSPHIGHO2_12_FULL_33_9 TaxID=1802045 RepID=A0A1F7HK08_9BACT|nr:MAG: hypothetical protein A3F29_03890 [Candidatus Roizmanbacteria bacterium RIFCSPHIGHO2_12_FULL_33_9]